MITREAFEQLKAFARIDGALVGCMWIVSFACFMGNFSNPLWGLLGMAIGVGSIVWAAMRLRRFRDNILEGEISFRRAFCYGVFVYLYAALIMAVGQYVYLQFLDNGYLMTQYMDTISRPEFSTAMQLYGIDKGDMKLAMDTLQELRPIDFALQFFTMNIILGVIISLPMASLMRSKKKRKY